MKKLKLLLAVSFLIFVAGLILIAMVIRYGFVWTIGLGASIYVLLWSIGIVSGHISKKHADEK
jgi:hypothetical protein